MRVIDNKKESVIDVLENLKQYGAKKLRFATGFLFFDGWRELKTTIPEDIEKFKIIFGFTDKEMALLMGQTLSNDEFRYLISKLARKLNDEVVEELGNDNNMLKKLADNGILEIKWYDKLHAKLYLYTRREDEEKYTDGKAIVGSSNLTSRGLTKPGELNFWIDSGSEIFELVKWFEDVWKDGKDLDSKILLNAIVNESKRRESMKTNMFVDLDKYGLNLWEAFLFVMWYILGGSYKVDIPELLKHNENAVVNGYGIIKKYGGVILADPVGTGKSFQALGLISHMVEQGESIEKVMLIAPPHLIEPPKDGKSHWMSYISKFFNVISISDLNVNISNSRSVVCELKNGDLLEISLISSYGLSRLMDNGEIKEGAIEYLSDYDVIIIDEAHHFKNKMANKRRVLDEIIKSHRGKYGENPYVILLTATPIINDVYEILSLFSIYTSGESEDGKTTLDFDRIARVDTDKNIIRAFEKYHENTKKLREKISEMDEPEIKKLKRETEEALNKIIEFLRGSIILRSRTYIEKNFFKKEEIIRPKLKNIIYEVTNEKSLINVIDKLTLEYFSLTPNSFFYVPKQVLDSTTGNIKTSPEFITLKGIMRILLAKRLESSSAAFIRTLLKLRRDMEETLRILEENEEDIDKIVCLLLSYKSDKEIDCEKIKRKIIDMADISDDEFSELGIEFEDYNKLKSHILSLMEENNGDSKITLVDIVEGMKADISLINEFLGDLKSRDIDMDDLYNFIFNNGYNSKEGALLDLLRRKKEENKKVVIYSMYVDTVKYLEKVLGDRFGEENILTVKGGDRSKQGTLLKFRNKDGFAVMISTDSLSEGVNLEFVDELINYDIPWTPSIIMQRVGRLWRTGRKKDILFYTVLPPEGLENEILPRVDKKINTIRDILIQEIALLREGEEGAHRELTPDFEQRVYGNIGQDQDVPVPNIHASLKEKEDSEPLDLRQRILNLIDKEVVRIPSALNEGNFVEIPVKNIVDEKKEIFEKIRNEIKNGKILNVSLSDDDKLVIIHFGKKYYLRTGYEEDIFWNENEVWKDIEKRWEKIKSSFEKGIIPEVSWIEWDGKIDPDKIINSFKSSFKVKYLEDMESSYKQAGEVLTQLALTVDNISQRTLDMYGYSKEEKEKLENIRNKIFWKLAYYYSSDFKRKGGSKKANDILRELGFKTKKGKIKKEKFLDIEALEELLTKLGDDVEEMGVEVIM